MFGIQARALHPPTGKSARRPEKHIRPARPGRPDVGAKKPSSYCGGCADCSPCRRVPHVRVLDSSVKVVARHLPNRIVSVLSGLPGPDETLVDEFTGRD